MPDKRATDPSDEALYLREIERLRADRDAWKAMAQGARRENATLHEARRLEREQARAEVERLRAECAAHGPVAGALNHRTGESYCPHCGLNLEPADA